MTTLEQIKSKVREYQVRAKFGRSEEDNFTPWWLQQKFKLSDEEAAMLCSDGNYDKGIDGFYIQETADKTILCLIQAKYSEDINQIKKGINDINRFIPDLAKLFKRIESDSYKENIIIKRIRPRIENIDITDSKPLVIEAYVICLSSLSIEFIENKATSNKADLKKTFEKEIENPNIALDLKIVGLDNLIDNHTTDIFRLSKPFEIYFNGSDEIDIRNVDQKNDIEESIFLSGFGKLSDLVQLYELKGNQLFDKNVRLFLYGKKNESKGPAGKIKETLELINNKNRMFPPEKFAFLHNGVTIYTTKVIHKKSERKIEISNPSILNGCQTIKSASFFFQETNAKGKLDIDIWENIPISIRIVATKDNNLWREVAEANNRQNSMSASALRANDEIQINLENNFKDFKIFYERQEASFENHSRVDRDKFDELYYNSPKEPINIETLASTIVCASDFALSYATRTNEIFESHKLYSKVFSQKNLYNLSFLVLAYNIRRVIHLSIDKAVPGNATKIYADFKGSKYRDLFTRLVLKVIVKNKSTYDYIEKYGGVVLTGQGKVASNLIEDLRQIIKSTNSPILQKTSELYRSYDKITDKYIWHKQDNQEIQTSIAAQLKINNIEIFERLATEF